MKIIFLGSQGSGKSTQAKILAGKLNTPYLEMGQIFRERAKDTDQEAQEIKKALEVGNLVPDQTAVKTLKDKLKEVGQKGYVLDGYPRNLVQLEGFNVRVDKVFYIKVSDEEGVRRLMLRKREDDTLEVLKRRLELYHQQTEPLLAHFRNLNNLEEINGEQEIEEIAQEIEKRIYHEEA